MERNKSKEGIKGRQGGIQEGRKDQRMEGRDKRREEGIKKEGRNKRMEGRNKSI